MKNIKLMSIIFLIATEHCYAQQKSANTKEIIAVINRYSECVIAKDSTAFYNLFNEFISPKETAPSR